MQTAQGTMLESLRSVESFLDAHADSSATSSRRAPVRS